MIIPLLSNLIRFHEPAPVRAVTFRNMRVFPAQAEVLLSRPLSREDFIDIILDEYEKTKEAQNPWTGAVYSEAGTPRGMTFYDDTPIKIEHRPKSPEELAYTAMNPEIRRLAHPSHSINYIVRYHLWGPENDLLIIPQNTMGDFTEGRDYPKLLPVLRNLISRTISLKG